MTSLVFPSHDRKFVAGCDFKAVYPDPENPGGIEELRRQEVNTREVIKGKGSVQRGVQLVREMLLNSQIHVNMRCINLIAEFETYSYNEDDTERNEDERPVKANDHALDALRYVVTSVFGKNSIGREMNEHFIRNEARVGMNSAR